MTNKMASIEDIKALTDHELGMKLKGKGVNVGPITDTTRPLLQKKLNRLLNDTKNPDPAQNQVVESTEIDKSKDCAVPSGPVVYFAVQIPIQAKDEDFKETCVLTDKKEALQLMKKYPAARFKIFPNKQLADEYANIPVDLLPSSPIPELNTKNATSKPVSEGSAFRGPKSPELVQFRRALEQGHLEVARKTVWNNPRYLISSGDTPVILQENFRYNALHVCANKNQAGAAELILSLLQDEGIFKLMYPDDTADTRKQRMMFLTDLYLNTPDKGINETPLHFACKFGNLNVVTVLVNHKTTDRNRVNKFGEAPKDIVCTRMRHNTPGYNIKANILALLDEQVYVPLVRAIDDSVPAHVIDPVSPEHINIDIQPQVMNSPKEVPLAIRAIAGPMSPIQAEKFRKTWTTPPSPSMKDKQMYASIRRGDPTKGLERIGRQLAQSLRVQWSEYWEFLDKFVDLTSQEGINLLEVFLKDRSVELTKELTHTSQVDALGSLLDELALGGAINQQRNDINNTMSTPKRFTDVSTLIAAPTFKTPNSVCSNLVKNNVMLSDKNPFMPKSLMASPQVDSPLKQSSGSDSINKSLEGDHLNSGSAKLNDSTDDFLSAALGGLTLSTNSPGELCKKGNSQICDEHNIIHHRNAVNQNGKDNTDCSDSKVKSNIGDGKWNGTDNSLRTGMSNAHSSKNNPVKSLFSNNLEQQTVLKHSGSQSSKPDENDVQTEGTSSIYDHGRLCSNLENKISQENENVDLEEVESDLDSSDSEADEGEDGYQTATDASDPDDSIFEESFDLLEGAVNDVFNKTNVSTPDRLYLFGQEPTKTDMDVFRAVENVHISPLSHPYLFKWRNTVTCYSEKSRTRWTATPSQRRLSQTTPRRAVSFNSCRSPYTPNRLDSSFTDDDDGGISFTADSNSSINSDSSYTSDDSVRRIRANLIPDFLSAGNA